MSASQDSVTPVHPRLQANIVSLYAVQAANIFLPILTIPYLTRVLGASAYGLVALAAAVTLYFAAFTDFGFGTTATREAAAARNDPQRLGVLIGCVTLIRMALLVISLVVLFGLVAFVPRLAAHSAVYLASALSLFGTALYPGWLLQGLESMRALALSTVLARTVSVALIFALVRGPQDAALVAALQSVAALIAILLVVRHVLTLVPPRYWRVDRRELRPLFADSRNAFAGSTAITLYTGAVTLVLGFSAPAAAVGAFSAATKMVTGIASVLWAPISQGVYPRVAHLLAHGDRHAAEHLLEHMLHWLLPPICVLSVALWIFAEPVVRLAFGPDMTQAIPVVRTLAFLPALLILSNFFGVLVLYSSGEFALTSRFQLLIALLSLIWLVPLVLLRGAEGAAWSTLATETAITAGFIGLTRKRRLFAWPRTT